MKIIKSNRHNITRIAILTCSLVILSCSSYVDNFTIINTLSEEEKTNINLNNFKGNFIISEKNKFLDSILSEYKINYKKSSLSINEQEKGFLLVGNEAIFISETVPLKNISFSLKIMPFATYLKIDENGNGVAISKKSSISPTGISDTPVYLITIKNYQTQSVYNKENNNDLYDWTYYKENILGYIPERDGHNVFNYLSSIELDNKGNGLVSYSYSNFKFKNEEVIDYFLPGGLSNENKINIQNKTNTVEIKNFKVLKDNIKSASLLDPVQLVKNYNNKLSVVGIPIIFKNYGELTNPPKIDKKGNGVITWFENFYPDNRYPGVYKIFAQKIIDYKLSDDKILLLTTNRSPVSCEINTSGRGVIVYTESEMTDKPSFGKLYFSEIRDFRLQEKEQISDSKYCVNAVVDITSKGNGLIVWEDNGKLFGRRLKNYQLQ